MPAYPTDCHPPIGLAQARMLVERYLHMSEVGIRPEGARLVYGDYGFCFTISKVLPPPPVGEDGIPLYPVEPGGGVIILDKESGEFSFWPSWGTSFAVEKYAQAKASDGIEHATEWPEGYQ